MATILAMLLVATAGEADWFTTLDNGRTVRARSEAAKRLVRSAVTQESTRSKIWRRLARRTLFESGLLLLEAMENGTEAWQWQYRWKALAHHARPVRHLAADILARNRDAGSIPHLIRALQREKKYSVQRVIVRTLESLTRRPYGADHRAWQLWWQKSREVFQLPEPLPKKKTKRKKTGETKTVASFYGVPVDATEIIFVIDRSASMRRAAKDGRTSRWVQALTEIAGVVGRLPKGARVNVIFFMSDVWMWRSELTVMTTAARNALRSDLAKQTPSGGTWLYDGVKAALQDPDVEAIYLLSDGEPSGGEFVSAGDIVREVTALNRLRRATIHCVAVGHGSPMLRRIAQANGGRYISK